MHYLSLCFLLRQHYSLYSVFYVTAVKLRSIGISTISTSILGYTLSIWAQKIITPAHQVYPDMPMALGVGITITTFGVLGIGCIATLAFYLKPKFVCKNVESRPYQNY